MSIKRSKQSSGSSRRNEAVSPFSFGKQPTPPEPDKTWEERTAGQPDEAFVPYSMKMRFAKGALISHPKFGKGAVVAVDTTVVEVLFSDGKKKLGHGAV
jgi:hypothetical protein